MITGWQQIDMDLSNFLLPSNCCLNFCSSGLVNLCLGAGEVNTRGLEGNIYGLPLCSRKKDQSALNYPVLLQKPVSGQISYISLLRTVCQLKQATSRLSTFFYQFAPF